MSFVPRSSPKRLNAGAKVTLVPFTASRFPPGHGGQAVDPRLQLWQPTGSRQDHHLPGCGPAQLGSPWRSQGNGALWRVGKWNKVNMFWSFGCMVKFNARMDWFFWGECAFPLSVRGRWGYLPHEALTIYREKIYAERKAQVAFGRRLYLHIIQ